jgi:beta-glucosidase
LRNENQLLPLKKDISSIAVIGPLADSQQDIEGSWTVMDQPSSAVTVLEGIRNKLGAGVRVEYAKGPDIKRDIPSFFEAFMPGPKAPPLGCAERLSLSGKRAK